MCVHKKQNPPIRRVSTKGAKLQQTLQSFSRVSTQSFSRDSVQSSSFSRDSALGVRRGGSAGVGGRGGRGGTLGYLRLRWVTFGYVGLPSVTFGTPFFWTSFLDPILNALCLLSGLPFCLRIWKTAVQGQHVESLRKWFDKRCDFGVLQTSKTRSVCWREHDFLVLAFSPPQKHRNCFGPSF